MALSITHLGTRLDESPGSASEVSNSMSFVAGRAYYCLVTQYRTLSADPAVPTLSGWSETWTEITLSSSLWTSTGGTRRRCSLFFIDGGATGSGSGVLTATYGSSNTPDLVCFQVYEVTGQHADDYVAVSESGSQVNYSGILLEFSATAPSSTDNRWLMFVVGNVSAASSRLELSTDTGGDANWTTDNMTRTSGGPTGTFLSGHLASDPNDDTTPGWYQTDSNIVNSMIVIELKAAAVAAGTIDGYWGTKVTISTPIVIPSTMLIGAEPQIQTVAQFNSYLTDGKEIQATRRYIAGAPTLWQNHFNFYRDEGEIASWISFKGSAADVSDSQLRNFLSSIPDDGFMRRVTWRHEPYDDPPPMSPSYFAAMQDRLHAAWVAISEPSYIQLAFCIQQWPQNHGEDLTAWYPTTDPDDWEYGMDDYSLAPGGGNDVQIAELFSSGLASWRAAGGTEWSIMETGCWFSDDPTSPYYLGPNVAADFITNGMNWARDEGCSGFLWWQGWGGPAVPPESEGGSYLYARGQTAIDAFSDQLP